MPDGKHYHGSPAVETSSDYCTVEDLATLLLIAIPVATILMYIIYDLYSPAIGDRDIFSMSPPSAASPFQRRASSRRSTSAWQRIMFVIPRLCVHCKGKTYTNFNFHYLLQSIVRGRQQLRLLYLAVRRFVIHHDIHALRQLKLNTVYQTGSNMGTEQGHDNPLLCNIGSGRTTADGLKMINMQMSATSFRLASRR